MYNLREIYTHIKINNNEVDQYDAEIYRLRFPYIENYKPTNFRENYEKVIIPIVEELMSKSALEHYSL